MVSNPVRGAPGFGFCVGDVSSVLDKAGWPAFGSSVRLLERVPEAMFRVDRQSVEHAHGEAG